MCVSGTLPMAAMTEGVFVTILVKVLGLTRHRRWAALVLTALAATGCSANHSQTRTTSCVGPVRSYYVASAAMAPTINVGRHVTVDQGAYKGASPQRGDIVVFTTPPVAVAPPSVTYIIKRIIGLPGENISSSPAGQILINGQPVPQPWLSQAVRLDPGPLITSQTIPTGKYYVLGDNRANSEDSRYFGPISRSSIVGKVMLDGCG